MPSRWVQPDAAGLAQPAHGRSRLQAGIIGEPSPERRLARGTRESFADVPSPQVFTSHPLVITAIDTTAAGSDAAAMTLPGRIVASTMADGEPGTAHTYGGTY